MVLGAGHHELAILPDTPGISCLLKPAYTLGYFVRSHAVDVHLAERLGLLVLLL